MIAAWMLYSIVVGVLVGAAALGAERVCSALRRPVRFVWAAALVATMLLSAAGLERSVFDDSTAPLPASMTDVVEAPYVDSQMSAGLLAAVRAGLDASETRAYGAVARLTGDGRALTTAWVAASVALLVLFAAALLRFGRARRTWRRERIGGVDVYVARNAGPALVGLRHPEIVMPAWLLRASEADQRIVVQHEEEHRIARDHLLLAGVCACVCLLPWNPAVWWLLRRTRLAVELDCDARVLRRGVGAARYGTLLLDVASRAPGLPLAPALADTSTHLERRIIAMTRTHDGHARRRAGTGALCTVFLGLAACSADMPTAAEIDQMDVAAAETHVRLSGQLVDDGQGIVFIVDGVETPAEEARALAPERIASIEITKGAAARAFGERAAAGVVHVRTKDPSAVPSSDDTPAGIRIRDNAAAAPGGRLEIRPADADGLGKEPLFIVDGVIVRNFKLDDLDRSAIEKIEVIKGPAAQKLYGERGANGVIHITLKK